MSASMIEASAMPAPSIAAFIAVALPSAPLSTRAVL
jgi:hypothetical protein